MSMRRPRIKPQVNLASTRRRNTAKATTNTSDAPKSDTQQQSEDNNESDKVNTTQLPNEDANVKEENQVQVSVIDYNETSENANGSTTEYMVTIQNEEKSATPSKQPKSKLKQPKCKQEHNSGIFMENPKDIKAKVSEDPPMPADTADVKFKMPNKHLEIETIAFANDNIIQMDMHKSAELPTEHCPESGNNTEKERLNEANISYDEANGSAETGTATTPQVETDLSAANVMNQQALVHNKQPSHGSRLRTTSSCSAYSDSNAFNISQPRPRKIDEQKRLQRAQSRRIFANGAPDKTVMKMSDLIYYNPPTAPMEIKSLQLLTETKDSNKDKPAEPEIVEEDPPSPKAIVPQLKLNAAGELVLDDKSLEIETTAEQQAKKTLANSSLIYVDEYTGMNGFYKRRPRTKDWPREETIKFYRCLQVIGTDFSCMLQLFPNRTRRDLKLKFKKEERINGQLINKAILNPKTFNVEDLKTQLEQEERERLENEKKAKEFTKKKPKASKVKNTSRSIAARVLKHGDDIYEHESMVIEHSMNKDDVSRENEGPAKDNVKGDEAIAVEQKERKKRRKKTKTDENANTENIGEEQPKKKRRGRPKIEIKEVNILPPFDVLRVKSEQIANATSSNARELDNSTPLTTNESLNEFETISTTQLEDDLNTLISNGMEYVEQLQPSDDTLEPKYVEAAEECVAEDTDSEEENETKLQIIEEGEKTTNETLIDQCHYQEDDDTAEDAIALLASIEVPEADTSDSDLGEDEIRNILEQIAEGSMALVSTLDPNDPDKVLNEIYIMNKVTGELSDTPLNVPDDLVQSILEVMT